MGSDFLFQMDVGGNAHAFAAKIGADSHVRLNEPVFTSIYPDADSTSPTATGIPVAIGIEEQDPEYQDYGTGGGMLRVILTPGTEVRTVTGSLQAVGPDAPASVALRFEFRIEVTSLEALSGSTETVVIDLKLDDVLRALQKDAEEAENKKRLAKIAALEAQIAEIQNGWFYWLGWGGGDVLVLKAEVKQLDGSVRKTTALFDRSVGTWWYTLSEYVTEVSPPGVFSRIVFGTSLTTGQPVSTEERVLEAFLTALGAVVLFRGASGNLGGTTRITRPKPGDPPPILEDVGDLMKARERSRRKSNAAIDEPKINISGSKAAHKEYEDAMGARDEHSFIFAYTDEARDEVIFFRTTTGGKEMYDVNSGRVQIGRLSEYREFIEQAMWASKEKPGLFHAGCHHAPISVPHPKAR